jgi:photosystem II stability/assembly factor-like uncharacterized protein
MKEPRVRIAAQRGAPRRREMVSFDAVRAAQPAPQPVPAVEAELVAEKPPLRRPAVPGGKALARLRFFEQQRGFAATDLTRSAAGRARRPAPSSSNAAPASPYLAAFAAKEALREAAEITPRWRPLGPFSIPHGQTYGAGPGSRPSVAGRISAVAVDPQDPEHVLIGAAGGGVWETRDGGATWSPRSDDQPSLAIGAIAFDPSNPSIVYAGTGEGDALHRLGAGLLRSEDGGATWCLRAGFPFEGTGFFDILVDPLDGDHLLAGTTTGLYESWDGGRNWDRRRDQRTWNLSMDPRTDGARRREVLAACADGVFRSSDGRPPWRRVSLPGSPAEFRRIEVRHAPSDGNVAYVFAAGLPDISDPIDATESMPTAYLWRRDHRRGPFRAFPPPNDLQAGQAWYDWFAAVAPDDPDALYLGAIDVHKGIRTAGAWVWANLSAKAAGDSIHPDQHAIAFSPTDPRVVFIGNDGGLYRSPDGGESWKSLNKGLCIAELEFLAQHPRFEAWLLAGTQDNGTLRYEGERVWFHVQDGDGGDCGLDASAPFICYHSFYEMGFERSREGGRRNTWEFIRLPESEAEPVGASLFYPPLEAQGPVIAQAGENVFISADHGDTWTRIPLPAGSGVATTMTIPSPDRIYVAASVELDPHLGGPMTGRLFRIDRIADVWENPVELTAPRAAFASDLLEGPTRPDRLWATYSSLGGSKVFLSEDGGRHWDDVGGGLPDIPINSIEIDPAHPDTVWIAADVGVYRSTNAGKTWELFGDGLPNALVKDLALHAESRLLRAATQSRGVWEIDVDGDSSPEVAIYLRHNAVDTGRLLPAPSEEDDPFQLGLRLHWWQCADLKAGAPPYPKAVLDGIDFEVFEDDHGVFASGLMEEGLLRSRVSRVYVQVHNRGSAPATQVAVKVFFTEAAVGLPELPPDFWTDFPESSIPPDSPWQPVAPHQILPTIEPGRSGVVGFEWAKPAAAPRAFSLLALITAGEDSIEPGELDIRSLVTGNRKCGLRSVAVFNPANDLSPTVRVLLLSLWPAAAGAGSLDVEPDALLILKGLILSRDLAQAARDAHLPQIDLDAEEQWELDRLIEQDPSLGLRLDLSTAFVPEREIDLSFLAGGQGPEPIVALLGSQPEALQGSILLRDENGSVVGGFTLQSRPL